MNQQELLTLAIGALSGCMGFFIRRLIRELDEVRRAQAEAGRERERESARVRDTYVKYEDFVRLQTSIDAKLTQIYELLAGGGV